MPYCPNCKTEYELRVSVCVDCGADLVNRPPVDEWLNAEEPVVVLRASSPDEAQVAAATLKSEGIPAYVLPGDPILPQAARAVGDTPELNVVVPADLVERAQAVLAAPAPTEDELAAVENVEDPEAEDA